MRRTATIAMLGVLALLACGGDDGTGSMAGMGATGTGGMASGGTGGMAGAGTGGMAGMGTGGTGGMAGDGAGGTGGGAPIMPTWSSIWDNALGAKPGCGGPFCHSNTGGGNLMMDTKENTYKALFGVAAMGMNLPNATNPINCKDSGLTRVVAGDPEMSLLYAKVRLDKDVPCGSRMPTGSMLTQVQVDAIKAWIMAGAKDD